MFHRGLSKHGGGACGVCCWRASIRSVAPPTSSCREFEIEIDSKSELEVLVMVVEKRKESKSRACGGLRRRK